MDDKVNKELDLENDLPFPRYTPRDEWMKWRKPVDDEGESVGWGCVE